MSTLMRFRTPDPLDTLLPMTREFFDGDQAWDWAPRFEVKLAKTNASKPAIIEVKSS